MQRYLEDHPAVFDPPTIALLSDALDEAWGQVQADKATYKVDGRADSARNALAKSIVDMPSRASGTSSV